MYISSYRVSCMYAYDTFFDVCNVLKFVMEFFIVLFVVLLWPEEGNKISRNVAIRKNKCLIYFPRSEKTECILLLPVWEILY